MGAIDLRSDTVTRPTPGMRETMAGARVGDDVYGEDPSVIGLEERIAERLGKEASLLFPSGTMANQVALHAHTRPGDVVLGARGCHVLEFESGAASALSGLHIRTLGREGRFEGEDVRAALRPPDEHLAPASVVTVENTHNVSGGRIFPADVLKGVVEAAREAGLALHLDGARLWNAAVATGAPPARLAAPFDTVSVCLSKGLGAPVGSVVACSRERLPRLRRLRKMYGGGMRQAGILAAAGLYALEHHVERLAEDHANARRLAEGLEALGARVPVPPETNIVHLEVADAPALVHEASERGVRLGLAGPRQVRALTHLDVSAEDVEAALERLRGLPALAAPRAG